MIFIKPYSIPISTVFDINDKKSFVYFEKSRADNSLFIDIVPARIRIGQKMKMLFRKHYYKYVHIFLVQLDELYSSLYHAYESVLSEKEILDIKGSFSSRIKADLKYGITQKIENGYYIVFSRYDFSLALNDAGDLVFAYRSKWSLSNLSRSKTQIAFSKEDVSKMLAAMNAVLSMV